MHSLFIVPWTSSSQSTTTTKTHNKKTNPVYFTQTSRMSRMYLVPHPNATNLASKALPSTEIHWDSEFLFCV